jgi:hypothetical protein
VQNYNILSTYQNNVLKKSF